MKFKFIQVHSQLSLIKFNFNEIKYKKLSKATNSTLIESLNPNSNPNLTYVKPKAFSNCSMPSARETSATRFKKINNARRLLIMNAISQVRTKRCKNVFPDVRHVVDSGAVWPYRFC